jgi:hypothetical protein
MALRLRRRRSVRHRSLVHEARGSALSETTASEGVLYLSNSGDADIFFVSFFTSKGRKKTRTGFTNLRKRRTNRDPMGHAPHRQKRLCSVRRGSEAIEARTAGFSR